jgi:hypothetical protein
MVIETGMPVQFAETPGLVNVRVLPPAAPEMANVPVQAAPLAVRALKVQVPENELVVVAPEIVPLNEVPTAYVPFTELPAWVKSIRMAWRLLLPLAV